jgi:hypothetical protein
MDCVTELGRRRVDVHTAIKLRLGVPNCHNYESRRRPNRLHILSESGPGSLGNKYQLLSWPFERLANLDDPKSIYLVAH